MINLLSDTQIIILSCVLSLVFIFIIGILSFLIYKSKKKGMQNDAVSSRSNDEFISLIGGVENIISFELKGVSRLVLVLKDYKKINKEELKKFYISRTLEMSDKIILVGENLKPLDEILKSVK
ncbi:MAG: hypothetical protein PUJ85_03005 [bacterium]|nr:hypothetical protein [bacterium]MDD7616313.1 hypothetical protein [bacterium]